MKDDPSLAESRLRVERRRASRAAGAGLRNVGICLLVVLAVWSFWGLGAGILSGAVAYLLLERNRRNNLRRKPSARHSRRRIR